MSRHKPTVSVERTTNIGDTSQPLVLREPPMPETKSGQRSKEEPLMPRHKLAAGIKEITDAGDNTRVITKIEVNAREKAERRFKVPSAFGSNGTAETPGSHRKKLEGLLYFDY
ncbi:unnamed protein product [Cochlearia groenlandica]